MFAIVTELLSGGSYLEHVRAGAGHQDVARWIGQIASALAHMHGLRMQHRDVKPDNVLMTGSQFVCGSGDAKLIDVGLSCTLGSKSRVSTKAVGMVRTNLALP